MEKRKVNSEPEIHFQIIATDGEGKFQPHNLTQRLNYTFEVIFLMLVNFVLWCFYKPFFPNHYGEEGGTKPELSSTSLFASI